MSVSSAASLVSSVQMPVANKSSFSAGQAATLSVFKKAVDIEAAQATQLIEAIQPPQSSASSSKLAPHLGSRFQASA